MPRRAHSRTRAGRLIPRVKVWLEKGGRYAFGFGMSEILQAVERAGTIKRAASDLGKSYRYVWRRIKDAEAAVGVPLVETQVGGQGTQRSFLTHAARKLVDDFAALRGRVMQVTGNEFGRRFLTGDKPTKGSRDKAVT